MAPTERPSRFGRFLLRLCRLGDRRSDVEADLHELFEKRVAVVGAAQARQRFTADVWSLLFPSRRSLTSGLGSDVRDALRALWRTPVQTASIYLCLVLGSTLTVGMFTVVNTMMAGNLIGIDDRDRLFRVVTVRAGSGDHKRLNVGPYKALPTSIPGAAGVAAQIPKSGATASVDGVPTRVRAQMVNGAYFQTLGTRPAAGRLLQPSDDASTAPPVVVLGFDLWQRAYGSRADGIGDAFAMGPVVYTVVGVAPRGFAGIAGMSADNLAGPASDAADVWMPEAHAAWGTDRTVLTCDNCLGPSVLVRLAPGTRPRDLTPHLSAAAAAYDADLRRRGVRQRAATGPGSQPVRFDGYALEPFRLVEAGTDPLELVGGIGLLMIVPFLALAIACANVAGVQLARTMRRTHELATRVALGATRLQLTRLIVLETLVVAVAAGLTAWFIVVQSLRWTDGLLPMVITADFRVFAFAVLAPVAVSIGAGLWPSWRATGFRVLDGLQQGAGTGGSFRLSRLRRLALVGQIAVSVALLGTSMHLARGVALAPAALAPLQTDVLVTEYRSGDLGLTPDDESALQRRLDVELRKVPGVTHVAFGEALLQRPSQRRAGPVGARQTVTREWFSAVGQEPVAGRIPTSSEQGVVVINETLAAHLGGRDAAVGQRVDVQDDQATAERAEVVGVIKDGYERLDRPMSFAYVVVEPGDAAAGGASMYIKGPGASAARQKVITQLGEAHPQLAPYQVGTIAEVVSERLRSARVVINALAAMSVVALLLAAVGLFGGISHSSSSRSREFGVRLALGATPRDVARIVFAETIRVSSLGLGAGLLLATMAAYGIRASMLATTSPFDALPATIVVTAVLLIAGLAAMTPMRRVMSINPITTLRGE